MDPFQTRMAMIGALVVGMAIVVTVLMLTGPKESTEALSGEETVCESVDAQQAALIIENNPEMPIIDVRTATEFSDGHLNGAVNIPLDDIALDKNIDLMPDKNQKYLIYCRSGNRSKQACELLEAQGFTNLIEMDKGIVSWTGEIVK